MIYNGDCLEVLAGMPENSIDTCITDPPYELGFMGKKWDSTGIAFQSETWEAVFRVLKPGALLLAFGGTRTYHRMVCAIEDAGFEIRDTIAWVYGSGFPKSLDVSKSMDRVAKKRWSDICKAIDNVRIGDIIQVWKKNCDTANIAVRKLKRNQTEVGDNMPRKNTVHESVSLTVNLKRSYVNALIAELNLSEAPLTLEGNLIAQKNVNQNTKQSNLCVRFVEKNSQDQSQVKLMEEPANNLNTITVQGNVLDYLKENIILNHRVDEALRTYYGELKSLNEGSINALCVDVINDLKHIILSQSKIFQSLDTTQQMECVSATSAIITEYTAERLITFMVDTLKNKALDNAQGTERKVVGRYQPPDMDKPWNIANAQSKNTDIFITPARQDRMDITAPATPEAQLWNGWGTGLKPAMELIVVAMKPLDGTYVNNALTWGVAGMWIDGGRIEANPKDYDITRKSRVRKNGVESKDYILAGGWKATENAIVDTQPTGRYPANFIHDGSEEVMELFPETGVSSGGRIGNKGSALNMMGTNFQAGDPGYGDSGSAARFFYCAKASRKERNAGLEGMPEGNVQQYGSIRANRGNGYPEATTMQNTHPSVKPLKLMQYLARLTKTPTGGTVLDPFMGSGSTGCACVIEGRDFIGIELESEYFEIAKKRIEYYQKQAIES